MKKNDPKKRIKSYHISNDLLGFTLNLWIVGDMEYGMRVYHLDTGFEYDFKPDTASGAFVDGCSIIIELHKGKIPIPILYHETLYATMAVFERISSHDPSEEMICRTQQWIVDRFVKQITKDKEFKFTWKYK